VPNFQFSQTKSDLLLEERRIVAYSTIYFTATTVVVEILRQIKVRGTGNT
jgi:hypothetical protein